MTAEHCFYHLAQALDRAAAAVVAIGAIRRTALIEVDWAKLTSPRNAARDRQASRFLEPIGEAGRDLQDRLLTTVDSEATHGPGDWLPWLLRARNSATHRPPKLHMNFLTGDRRSSKGMVRPFYRQPGWTDTESLAAGGGGEGPSALLLMKDTPQILDGLVGSTSGLLTAIGNALHETWLARRADPRLLVQPGEQWPTVLGQPTLTFQGYGPDARVHEGGAVHVSPEQAKRLKASKVMDAERARWQDPPR